MSHHYLNQLFAPQSVAVFGASEREKAVGTVVFQNLLSAGFKGALYPINPKHIEVQGQAAYPNLLLYVEGIHDARGFMSGLRTASRMKPVIVLKAGRYEEGSRAVMSHTGAIVGRDDAFDAALERAGVVRANTIAQLFSAAQILSSGIRVQQDRLLIITNGGGPGVMATDRAVEMGLRMAELAPATLAELNKVLPFTWSHGNPVDILGDADPERYAVALKICMQDENIDGILVMLTVISNLPKSTYS